MEKHTTEPTVASSPTWEHLETWLRSTMRERLQALLEAEVSRVTQFSLVVVIENSLPVPCMVGYAIASAPLRRPALIFSLSR